MNGAVRGRLGALVGLLGCLAAVPSSGQQVKRMDRQVFRDRVVEAVRQHLADQIAQADWARDLPAEERNARVALAAQECARGVTWLPERFLTPEGLAWYVQSAKVGPIVSWGTLRKMGWRGKVLEESARAWKNLSEGLQYLETHEVDVDHLWDVWQRTFEIGRREIFSILADVATIAVPTRFLSPKSLREKLAGLEGDPVPSAAAREFLVEMRDLVLEAYTEVYTLTILGSQNMLLVGCHAQWLDAHAERQDLAAMIQAWARSYLARYIQADTLYLDHPRFGGLGFAVALSAEICGIQRSELEAGGVGRKVPLQRYDRRVQNDPSVWDPKNLPPLKLLLDPSDPRVELRRYAQEAFQAARAVRAP